jgi:hypothetical protein
VAVSLLGTYTVVDIEDYLPSLGATTASWELEELDLVLRLSADPVHSCLHNIPTPRVYLGFLAPGLRIGLMWARCIIASSGSF